MSSIVLAIIGGVLLLFLIILVVISRIKVAGPNEAFIVTGRKGRATRTAEGGQIRDLSGQKVVMGAAVFVMPVVQKLHKLDLSSRGIRVEINGAVSKQGIRTDLQGVAIVKVGGSEDAIRAAAQRFLHQQTDIDGFTREVLAGALRSIVGRLTVEEVIRDRAAFGFGAAIASAALDARSPVPLLAAAGIGAVAALPAGWLALRLVRAAQRMHTDATPTRDDLAGALGVVVTPIPAHGYGEVRVSLGGQPVKLNATADDPIPLGAQVFVITAPSETSVVVERVPD